MLVIKNFVPHDTNQIGDEKKFLIGITCCRFCSICWLGLKKNVIIVEMLVTASLDVNWIMENFEVECNFDSGRHSTAKVLSYSLLHLLFEEKLEMIFRGSC